MVYDMLHVLSIESFNHEGLRKLYEEDDRRLLQPDLVDRISTLLAYLDAAKAIESSIFPACGCTR